MIIEKDHIESITQNISNLLKEKFGVKYADIAWEICSMHFLEPLLNVATKKGDFSCEEIKTANAYLQDVLKLKFEILREKGWGPLYRMQMAHHGNAIELLGAIRHHTGVSEPILVRLNKINKFNFNVPQAEAMLQNEENGTLLLRESSAKGAVTLSYKIDDEIKHVRFPDAGPDPTIQLPYELELAFKKNLSELPEPSMSENTSEHNDPSLNTKSDEPTKRLRP